MNKRTGHHSARRLTAKAEPSPITALRDLLATAFAADVAAVTPEVCELLRAQTNAASTAAQRDVLRNALVVLARHSAELSLAIADEVRIRFDAKLAPGDDPHEKTSHLSLDEISLMDDTGLELDLALDQCSARLREQTSAAVTQLTGRMCEMLGRGTLADAENPILPRFFARALINGIARLGFGEEAKLAVFKAYGPALLHIAPDLYVHANALLAERGMLAIFDPQYGSPRLDSAARPSAPAGADENAHAATLERLMTGPRVPLRQ